MSNLLLYNATKLVQPLFIWQCFYPRFLFLNTISLSWHWHIKIRDNGLWGRERDQQHPWVSHHICGIIRSHSALILGDKKSSPTVMTLDNCVTSSSTSLVTGNPKKNRMFLYQKAFYMIKQHSVTLSSGTGTLKMNSNFADFDISTLIPPFNADMFIE